MDMITGAERLFQAARTKAEDKINHALQIDAIKDQIKNYAELARAKMHLLTTQNICNMILGVFEKMGQNIMK